MTGTVLASSSDSGSGTNRGALSLQSCTGQARLMSAGGTCLHDNNNRVVRSLILSGASWLTWKNHSGAPLVGNDDCNNHKERHGKEEERAREPATKMAAAHFRRMSRPPGAAAGILECPLMLQISWFYFSRVTNCAHKAQGSRRSSLRASCAAGDLPSYLGHRRNRIAHSPLIYSSLCAPEIAPSRWVLVIFSPGIAAFLPAFQLCS